MQIALTPLYPTIVEDGRPFWVRMLRSITALSLVGLYFVSITFLTLSGLCAMSEHSGQHQMLIRDHKVILHHAGVVARAHHSFAAIFSNSSEHDHEIAYTDLLDSTQSSEKKRMVDHGDLDTDQADLYSLSNNIPFEAQSMSVGEMRHRNAIHAGFLDQWRHLRLNI